MPAATGGDTRSPTSDRDIGPAVPGGGPAVDDAATAVIGMAGRFPGASSVEELWQNLCAGVESISFFSRDELLAGGEDPSVLDDPNYVPAGGTIRDPDWFDAAFFGYSPREALVMDPQQRIFLECAWEALENAGYDPDAHPGRIGVYAGASLTGHLWSLRSDPRLRALLDPYEVSLAGDKDFLATRVSYKLNLRGPSMSVQTACSTSLVAIHLAAQSLLGGECDMALAGGVSVEALGARGYLYRPGHIGSPDGHCRAFDASAEGTVSGQGVGIVVLKRLADALAAGDHVHAVLLGSAINNDGGLKLGFTAPSAQGQAEVIRTAHLAADVDPGSIGFVEAHGTGTALGDPIEVAALIEAFGAGPEGRCALGAVKTNIGHLNAAAGVAGFIKAALAVELGIIPPTLHFEEPNPHIPLRSSPFYVNAAPRLWTGSPRRAGVSSFGIGGTNAHAVLEEPPEIASGGAGRPLQILPLSARTGTALDARARDLAAHLERHPDLDLADVAHTLQVGRRPFPVRRAVVAAGLEDAVRALAGGEGVRGDAGTSGRPVSFLFPGQGSQHVGMAREVYEAEPAFRERIDRCCRLLEQPLGFDLREVLYPDGARSEESGRLLDRTSVAQPALFVVEYALAELLAEWGVRPDRMIGHSVGEYVAACLAGVMSLQDALELVAERGRLMQALPEGAMVAVSMPWAEAERASRGLSVAAVNGPGACVLSGPTDRVRAFAEATREGGVGAMVLRVDRAFHSPMVEEVLGPFVSAVRSVELRAPAVPYVSNATGDWIQPGEATDPAYWGRHMRHTVRFSDGLERLLADPDSILVEVGPGQVLATLARRHPAMGEGHTVLPTLPRRAGLGGDERSLLTAVASLWTQGTAVDWPGLHGHERRLRVPLPTYRFERLRFSLQPREARRDGGGAVAPALPIPAALASEAPLYPRLPAETPFVPTATLTQRAVAEVWSQVLRIDSIGLEDDFFALGGDSLVATQVVSRLREAFLLDLPLAWLFDSPTVGALAELIEGVLAEGDEPVGAAGDGIGGASGRP